ncbi:MAG: DUF2784 family protein [Dysgonamonadaceae bacterium]|jgi:hypothetical protein|nr:DUF2784 family protein [Dysgonamonadaceae bacterium]MDD3355629.1 DUF2784 family protein [Dysgonamonadaceae bacterium]MDD3726888.1 DUF2784 family protein [Dysgonamonadaceae bacterium]MDD4246338.1 DUF2784 family protein [Dysgonamonadaceae bacterium]HUI33726.1 DUF2784 family protein [Dysgonamonadaceae bacterium]
MNIFYWQILDYFFVIFHTFLILFNLTGWIWKPTRRLHLLSLLLTGGSWLLLGLFYGLGYCPLTDWHFSVLINLGEYDLPYSYIQYLIERLSGYNFSAQFIDNATLIGYLIALALSLYFNFFSPRKKNSKK